jgi:superfamily II DNA/RNA helicase
MSAPEPSLPSEPVNDTTPPSDVLKEAREAARKDRNYDSAAVRRVIEDQFREIYDNNKPYDWQLDVAEALILGQDCIAIAGTGSGKTMPFGMPLMHPDYQDRIVLVLSPLNELEVEQVRTFPHLRCFWHILMPYRPNDSRK